MKVEIYLAAPVLLALISLKLTSPILLRTLDIARMLVDLPD